MTSYMNVKGIKNEISIGPKAKQCHHFKVPAPELPMEAVREETRPVSRMDDSHLKTGMGLGTPLLGSCHQ